MTDAKRADTAAAGFPELITGLPADVDRYRPLSSGGPIEQPPGKG